MQTLGVADNDVAHFFVRERMVIKKPFELLISSCLFIKEGMVIDNPYIAKPLRATGVWERSVFHTYRNGSFSGPNPSWRSYRG